MISFLHFRYKRNSGTEARHCNDMNTMHLNMYDSYDMYVFFQMQRFTNKKYIGQLHITEWNFYWTVTTTCLSPSGHNSLELLYGYPYLMRHAASKWMTCRQHIGTPCCPLQAVSLFPGWWCPPYNVDGSAGSHLGGSTAQMTPVCWHRVQDLGHSTCFQHPCASLYYYHRHTTEQQAHLPGEEYHASAGNLQVRQTPGQVAFQKAPCPDPSTPPGWTLEEASKSWIANKCQISTFS